MEMNAPLISLIVGLELLAAPDTPDRPLVQARINDQPVRLTIDTCAGRLVVFTHAADRIGLKYDLPRGGLDPNRARPGRTILFRSRSCRLEIDEPNRPALRLQDVEGRRPLWLAALPPGLRLAGVDGVIGWPNVSNCILHLDSGQGIFESLPHLPTWMPPWQRLKLHAPWGLHVLALEVSSPSRAQKAVYIDTGDPGGVKVSSDLWREIVAQQPDVPVALEGYYTPALGCILQRITWLKRLQLGA